MTQVVNVGSPIVLICLGATFLVLGYRLVKVVAVVNLAAVGAVLGHDVAEAVNLSPPMWGAAIGGLLFGLLAIPLLRAAVVVAVASLAGLVAKSAWVALGGAPPMQWAALAGGFAVGALLALVFFRFIMITTASIMGAALVVYGGASLIEGKMLAQTYFAEAKPASVLGCAAAFVVLVLAGIIAQYRGARRLKAKRGDA